MFHWGNLGLPLWNLSVCCVCKYLYKFSFSEWRKNIPMAPCISLRKPVMLWTNCPWLDRLGVKMDPVRRERLRGDMILMVRWVILASFKGHYNYWCLPARFAVGPENQDSPALSWRSGSDESKGRAPFTWNAVLSPRTGAPGLHVFFWNFYMLIVPRSFCMQVYALLKENLPGP